MSAPSAPATRTPRSMVTPAQTRTQAAALVSRKFGRWVVATATGQDADLTDAATSIPLHPPTQQVTASRMEGVSAWVSLWQRADTGEEGVTVQWEDRQWAAIGRQHIPVRLEFDGAEALARWAGQGAPWRTGLERCRELLARLRITAPALAFPPEAAAGLARHAAHLAALTPDDADRFIAVVCWLAAHDPSGLFIRQLPVRGVDTKWLERHRSMVEAVVEPITGRAGLGLRDKAASQNTIRLRFLDSELAPGGISDLAAPVEQLAALKVTPSVVVGVENLETLLSMPPAAGTIAVWGQGYAYKNLSRLPWVATAVRLIYWGDLDSHGLAILAGLRHHFPHVRSVLMGADTLAQYRDLAVTEPSPRPGHVTGLTAEEDAALNRIRAEGNLRLEQERIPIQAGLAALRAAGVPFTGADTDQPRPTPSP